MEFYGIPYLKKNEELGMYLPTSKMVNIIGHNDVLLTMIYWNQAKIGERENSGYMSMGAK